MKTEAQIKQEIKRLKRDLVKFEAEYHDYPTKEIDGEIDFSAACLDTLYWVLA